MAKKVKVHPKELGKILRPITLSPEQIKRYLANDDTCPVCESPNVMNCDDYYHNYTGNDLPPNCHMQGCNECYAWWVDRVAPDNCKLVLEVREVNAYTMNTNHFIMED